MKLIAAARQAEAEPTARALIITGGTEYFSAGADLNDALAVNRRRPAQLLRPLASTPRRWKSWAAGGLPRSRVCITGDARWRSRATSGSPARARTSPSPLTHRHRAGRGRHSAPARIVGIAKALELMFSAETIDASKLTGIGLINRLVPAGAALKEACAWPRSTKARAAQPRLIKRAVRQGMQMESRLAVEFEDLRGTTIYGTEDKQEGFRLLKSARLPSKAVRYRSKAVGPSRAASMAV